MNSKRAFVVVGFTMAITVLLSTGWGTLPPLGKVLDPFQGFWQNAETAAVKVPKKLSLPGLKAPVIIHLDEHLVPHINAQSDWDMYLAQGYITAFHRLWQMDFQTYVAAGRISELIGPGALDFDRLQRRKGLLHTARRILEKIKSNDIASSIVEAYVAGVNAYIDTLTYRNLPIEYKLMNYRPECWTPLKLALIMMLLVDDLCGDDFSLENTYAYHFLGKEAYDFIFPTHFRQTEPVVPQGTPWSFKPITLQKPPLVVPELRVPLRRVHPSSPSGSNNWVVAGKKTASGAPLLANDPHLIMRLPSVWYGVHLQSPTVNVAGASFAGLPGVTIGFNETVAWGVTNATRDVKDWYVVEFKDETRREYHYDQLLLKSQFVTEEIKIKGQESFYDTVVYTHWGPVVYDENFKNREGRQNLAMKWLGHYPNEELLAFYRLNRAKDVQDIEAALQHYDIPGQNVGFASVHDDIGIQVAGRYPAKWSQQGSFVMPGNTAAYEWQAFIPKAQNPKLSNPTTGYISSANERATDWTYPYYYHHYQEEHYRNRRINQVLRDAQAVDEKAMMNLQLDNYNLMAQESLPVLMGYVDAGQLTKEQLAAYQLLVDWDGYNDAAKLAPSVFEAWRRCIQKMIWRPLLEAPMPMPMPVPHFYRTVEILRDHPSSPPHLTLEPYETTKALVHDAFLAAVQELQDWQAQHQKPYCWGNYRPVFINHLAKIAPFGVRGLQVGGGKHIVNANEGERGASLRLVVDLKERPCGWFVYPGGQSGNPGSPYYTDLVPIWEKDEYITISTAAAEEGTCTMVLRPQN